MFTIGDIRNIAVQIEENGEKTYRKAASLAATEQVAAIFEWMADEEQRHARWFARLRAKKVLTAKQREIEDMGRMLLQDMIRGNTFLLDEKELKNAQDMQDAVTGEGPRQAAEMNVVAADPDIARVAPSASVQQTEPEAVADDGMDGIPVLDMKEIAPLAEHAALVFLLDAEPLLEVDPADPLLQDHIPSAVIDFVAHPAVVQTFPMVSLFYLPAMLAIPGTPICDDPPPLLG